MSSVSFIVTTVDKTDEVMTLLTSINDAAIYAGKKVEVVFVMQGRCQYTTTNFEKFTHISLLIKETEKKSLSKARNTAIALSNSDWLVMIDDDATVSIDFIQHLLNLVQDYPDVQIFCGRILDNRLKTPLLYFFADETKKVLQKEEYQFFMGSSHIVRRDAFEQIGTYNEKLGAGSLNYSGEETELFLRALHFRKKVIYAPSLLFYHPSILTQEDEKKIRYKKGHGALVRAIFNSYDRNIFHYNFIFLKPLLGYLFYAVIKTKKNTNGFKMNMKMFKTLLSGFFNY